MNNLVLIQARCGSTRLPNKILKPLARKPALERVIQRVQMSKNVDEIMVITSIDKENLAVVKLCADLGVRVFVGSEDDVLDRYYQAAKLLLPRYVIRVTGDCPLFDGGLLDQAIETISHDTDYLGMMSETFPDGLDLEIMTYAALEHSWENAKLRSEREHVTLYIKNNPNQFVCQDFVCDTPNVQNIRLTLDEQEDYQLISNIYNHFSSAENLNFNYKDILNYINENPYLKDINKKYARNEGMAFSIQNDKIIC